MLKKVEAKQKGNSHMSMQTVRQPKSDPVMQYGPWFIIVMLVLTAIASAYGLITGKAIREGFFGLALCGGAMAFLISLYRKE